MAGKAPRRRAVKCKATGEKGYSDEFFKAPAGGYYKSEEVYNDYRSEIDAYNEVKIIIDEDILGYDPNLPYNSLTPYNLNKLKGYSNLVLLETVKKYYDEIIRAVSNKEFRDSGAKCTYVFAIIKSHANDVKREMEREEKMRKRFEEKATNSSLADELMTEALNAESNQGTQKKRKDISSFLSEEEMQ